MKRPLGPILAIMLLAGCQSPAPPNDPFLYRSTIPPPGTMVPGAQPYYPTTVARGTVPGPVAAPVMAPPLVTPGTPVAPGSLSPAPVMPANPAAPGGPPNNYAPPGGFNFPQSSTPLSPPSTNQPTAAPAGGSNAQPATDTSVISASTWPAATQPKPASPPIRIVEPPATPAATNSQATNVSPGTPTTSPSTAPVPISRSASRQNDPAAPTEITDLPAVGSGANVVPPAAVASTAAANSAAPANPFPRATNYAPPTTAGSQPR